MDNHLLRELRRQHAEDLKIYRSAHLEGRNRILHWIMIPIELFSALLLITALVPPLVPTVIGLVMGMCALAIAADTTKGWACLFFHIVVVAACLVITQNLDCTQTIAMALILWTLAWGLQVGVGHWIWEKNQPNVADMGSVSLMAIFQSVLIAWSS